MQEYLQVFFPCGRIFYKQHMKTFPKKPGLQARTDAAMFRAKQRDDWKCVVCGQGREQDVPVEGAHLLVRRFPFPRWRQDNEEFIPTLCTPHHREYDKDHDPIKKAAWWFEKGLKEWGNKVLWIIGEM